MGKTSSEVKRRYNNKAYDAIQFFAPKGFKGRVKKASEDANESMAGYMKKAIETRMTSEGHGEDEDIID